MGRGSAEAVGKQGATVGKRHREQVGGTLVGKGHDDRNPEI